MPGELIPIVMFMSVAAVLILRPITTRLGQAIERSHDRKQAVVPDEQVHRLMQLMESLADRMDRLEDRVDFAERILERQSPPPALGKPPLSANQEMRRQESRSRKNDT